LYSFNVWVGRVYNQLTYKALASTSADHRELIC
jgi:hypothetical protein